MDQQKMMAELQRQDSNIPLQGFSFPKLREKYREQLELPDKFLRACTLREGTWVIILFLNSVALSLIGFLMMCLVERPEMTDTWWKNRFRDDFDFYYMNENKELIEKLWPMWVPLAQAIIVVKFIYFFTGILVLYALVKKTVHPFWYLPWIIMTVLLCTVMWLISFLMVISLFVLLTYRPLTVTWDVGPIACIITYSVAWTYSGFVVIAHYKRRWIVKYWRDRGMVMGTDGIGGQAMGTGY